MDEAVYLYCFANARLLPPLEGMGIDGENPLFLFVCNEVAAVVSAVSAEEFCGPEAEARLHDLAWVGPRACLHQEVIAGVMRGSPVLPVRFGTIFYSLESLEDRLRTHYGAVVNFLDRMVGREEWGVKVMWDRLKTHEELFTTMLADNAQRLSASPGTRYFQEQKIRSEVEKKLHRRLKETCDKVALGLEKIVSEIYARKVFPGRATGDNRKMFCNWAVLIAREDLPKLQEHISRDNESYSSLGLSFELTGPWPPYSFCPFLDEESSD